MAARKSTPKPKASKNITPAERTKKRGPFAHAADYGDALAELDRILAECARNPPPRFDNFDRMRKSVGVASMNVQGFLSDANETIIRAHEMRRACRRVLIAQSGIRNAQRWNGWKLPSVKAKS